ncbi:hypoxanthine phosphoribosyltransferase [bacterium]|nr:MAG: hypoxanthine phosphoribosyltransferase [bacterium]
MTSNLKLIIPPEEIHIIINRLAKEIRNDYATKNPVIVCVLKGAMIFFADLVRALKMPFEIDFVETMSYRNGTLPSSDVIIIKDTQCDVSGRDVLIVECIVDRGVTATALIEYMRRRGADSVKFCALLMRSKPFTGTHGVDYIGARIENGYVIGYGLDYNEHFRGLPGLYIMQKPK